MKRMVLIMILVLSAAIVSAQDVTRPKGILQMSFDRIWDAIISLQRQISAVLPGLSCYDLNANYKCDLLAEDKNLDGNCDAFDCQGPKGDAGSQGIEGPQGASGEQGPKGDQGVCDTSRLEALETKVAELEKMLSSPEKCDGLDNDMDGGIDEDFYLGSPCDGPDSDLCEEGNIVCDAQGGVICSDATADSLELCDSLDNDCDTVIDEGFSIGGACDGADPDSCSDGVFVCNAEKTGTVCNDDAASTQELCDSIDNDCDGVNNEGYALGMACDGLDSDLCNEGVTVCSEDRQGTACDDDTMSNEELCDSIDNDCDGMNNEGFNIGLSCDGADADLCNEGLLVCSEDHLSAVCNDITVTNAEICGNGFDDDCDKLVDEGC